jgi:hypothetical protein
MDNKFIKTLYWLGFILAGFIYLGASAVSAQEALTFTITPPLIKNNVSPGQDWHSAVRVVNNNAAEMDIYVKVMDFKGGGESGNVQLLKDPELNEGDNFLLSKWILVDPGPYKLAPYSSKDIPFIVNVPENAEPGGHYAAILAGTQPPSDPSGGSVLKVSSLLGSLLFLRVQGDIEERGWIREFSTGKNIFSEPKVDFNIKFENSGNVHIRPEGEIKITTMFGKEKEPVKINHATDFNYVLPGDIRKWEFGWEGDKSLFEMGRYKAELILVYGEQTRETSTQTLYFWVIYLKPLLIIFSSLIIFILLLIWFIRSYVRRALKRTQAEIGAFKKETELAPVSEPAPRRVVKKKKVRPEEEIIDKQRMDRSKKKAGGPVDLRNRLK